MRIKFLFPLFVVFIFSVGIMGVLYSSNIMIDGLNKVNSVGDTISKSINSLNSLSDNNPRAIDKFINEKEEDNNIHTLDYSNDSMSSSGGQEECDPYAGMDDYEKNNSIFTKWNGSLKLENSSNSFYYSGVLPREELKSDRCKVVFDPRLDCYRYNLTNNSYNDTVFEIAADGRFTFMTNCTDIGNMSFKIEVNNIYFWIKKIFTVTISLNNSTKINETNTSNKNISNNTVDTNKIIPIK